MWGLRPNSGFPSCTQFRNQSELLDKSIQLEMTNLGEIITFYTNVVN